MESEEEVLHGLTRVTTEFFDANTSNARKREIEQQLEKFGNQTGVWKNCLYTFTKTDNYYVQMYCLQVLEKIVNKMWIGLDPSVKNEIRTNLTQLLLHHFRNLPTFIVNKLIKVIVDIGRVDWPMFYANFFEGILSLASNHQSNGGGDTRMIGLIALKMTSEEFTSPREDVSAGRKAELRQLMTMQVPEVLKTCAAVLDSEWKSNFAQPQTSDVSIATPPPSPGSTNLNLFDLFTQVDNCNPFFSFNFALSPNSNLTDESITVIKTALECLSQYFSWIPLSDCITVDVITSIFRYARLGLCDVVNSHNPNERKLVGLATHALVCVNELISKNCIPQNLEEFLVRIFRQMFHLLQQITSNENTMKHLDNEYLKNFIIFLRLFVSQHFSRIESNRSFPLMTFLNLLLKFTFTQPDHDDYKQCLDIWEILIDFVDDQVKNQLNDQASGSHHHKKLEVSVLKRYSDGLSMFGNSILQTIQFTQNHSNIDELDNTDYDDNGHTDWENYLIKNLEVIATVTNILPNDVLPKMYLMLERTASVFLSANWRAISPNTPQYQHLIWSLKDLATTLQAFGRVSEIFLTEHFRDRFDNANALVQKLLHVSLHCVQMDIYSMNEIGDDLKRCVTEIHAQVLAALQPYTHWLSQLYSEAQQMGNSQAHLSQLLDGYVNSIVPVISRQVPEKIIKSAVHTCSSVVTTVRATFLLQIPAMEKFYHDVINGSCNKLDMQTQQLIYKTLSNLLVLPWPNTPECEQKWKEREESHKSFINSLLHDFALLSRDFSKFTDVQFATSAKPCVHRAIMIMNGIVDSMKQEVGKSRDICYASLRDYILISLQLIDIYIHSPDISEVLMSFYLTLFTSLRRQIGVEVVSKTIQKFLNIFTSQLLQENILHENSAGARVVDIFIKTVELVIDEAGQPFKVFTGGIIVLAVEQIYPIVRERPLPDLNSSLFGLLHRILSRRHRYFFPSPVLQTLLQDNNSDGNGERKLSYTISHKDQFVAIMTAFGNSFLQSDIMVFKQNLDALQDLNMKQKLYEKIHGSLFQEGILFHFVFCLIRALIEKSHDLLMDDICVVVHTMCTVDFTYFHSNLLRQFLQNVAEVTPDQKETLYRNFHPDQDLPTYTNNLLRFVNDLRFYRLCNSSLPRGTVQF